MTLTLAAAGTIQGVAGSATSVTYSIFGDEITAGPTNTFKKLAQGQLAASAGVLYTAPGSTATIVKTVILANTTGAGVAVTVYVDGTAAANVIGSFTIPAGGEANWSSNGWNMRDANGASVSTSSVALTGDVTGSGTGSIATTLATVNANVGSFGTASSVGAQTVNAKGLTTAASAIPILITESQVTNLVTDLAGKQATGSYVTALTGDVTAAGPGSAAATLATVNASPGTTGDASHTSAMTTNAKGLVTTNTSTAIQIAESQVTNLVTDLAGKQATGNYVTALTGDITAAGPGSAAATLATVNSNVGSFGDASHVAVLTANGKGLITAASSTAIAIASGAVSGLGSLATVSALTGDVTSSGAATTLATVNTNTGSWGDASHVGTFTVNAKGLVTAAGSTSIAIAAGAVSGLNAMATTNLSGDVTSSGAATTLATVNANVGAFGDASHVGAFTVNAKGLTTAASSVAIAIANTAVSGLGTLSTQSGTFSGTHSGTSTGTNTGDQNLFASVTGNTGTATAETTTDTIAITGSGSVSTVATDTPDGLVISNALATFTTPGNMSTAQVFKLNDILDATADFGIIGDLFTTCISPSNGAGDASITGGTTLLTCSSGPFSTTDVGKRITIPGAGASGAQFTGTIASYVSATQINVNTNVSTTVSAKNINFGTDNTTALTSLMNFVNARATLGLFRPGFKIIFPYSQTNGYGITIPLLFTSPVQIEGIGGGHTADSGDYTRIGGTRLAWWGTDHDGGTAFASMITFTPNPTVPQSLKKVALRHLWVDCRNNDQNQALIGVKFASCQGWEVDDFFVMDPLAIGIWFDVASSPTEAKDCTRGLMTDFGLRVLDNTSSPAATTLTPTTTTSAVNISTSQSLTLAAANGLRSGSDYIWVQTNTGKPTLARYTGGGGTTTLTGVVCSTEDSVHTPTTVSGSNVVQASPSNACAIYLNGGTGANTCCNTFLQGAISHGTTWGPAAIEFGNSDSNDFQSVFINGGARAATNAINRTTKPGVRVNGSNVSNSLAARNNTFRGGDPGSLPTTNGGLECTGVINTGALMTAPSGPTYWELHQMGNGAPVPVVEAGASLFWSGNGLFREGGIGSSSIAAQTLTAAVGNIVTGSTVVVPPQGWQIGTRLQWRIPVRKTAVGTSWSAGVRQHSSLTVGGGTLIANVTFTASTAIDAGELIIDLVCATLGGSGTAVAEYYLSHALAITGLCTGAVTAGTIDLVGATGQHHVRGAMTAFNTAAAGSGPTFLWVEINPITASTAMTVDAPVTITCVKAANP